MADREKSERELAARFVSVGLGETGAPWEDVCARNSCSHYTCEAIWSLIDAGLLDEERVT